MRRKNNIGMLFICGMAAVTVSGCGSKNVTNCEVLSVDGSVSGNIVYLQKKNGLHIFSQAFGVDSPVLPVDCGK